MRQSSVTAMSRLTICSSVSRKITAYPLTTAASILSSTSAGLQACSGSGLEFGGSGLGFEFSVDIFAIVCVDAYEDTRVGDICVLDTCV